MASVRLVGNHFFLRFMKRDFIFTIICVTKEVFVLRTSNRDDCLRLSGVGRNVPKKVIRCNCSVLCSVLRVALPAVAAMNFAVSDAADISGKTSIGGYGELHVNYTKPAVGTVAAPVLDFHRWILFVSHRWTEHWSFASELELEHNFVEGGKTTGELELEQAYIQFNPRPEFLLQTGVLLPATGLINDKHEPNLFLSVERPVYAKAIIPTTWFGNGIAARGLLAGAWQYSALLLEGLDDRKFGTKGIRGGRQKGFKASLETVLVNSAVDYVAIPGLNIGTSAAINVLAHDPTNTHPYASTILWELHAQYRKSGLWTQLEFGSTRYSRNGDLAGSDTLAALENAMGYYVDLGYDVARLWKAQELQLYPFIRVSHHTIDGTIGTDGTAAKYLLGLGAFPIENVTFKADYAVATKKGVTGTNGMLNIGAGYAF